ncbi:hypothetical protein [Halodesulfovibrio marinisediminis]|nr:hypothetical protein [Halodesulfovibrio marinisediminis]
MRKVRQSYNSQRGFFFQEIAIVISTELAGYGMVGRVDHNVMVSFVLCIE